MSKMFYVRCALSAIFGICALIMAINKIPGWGWFLFLAFVAIPDGTVYRVKK